MCEKSNEFEIETCDSCGRDFTVDIEVIRHAMERVFCPDCLTPYLLDED